MSFNIDISFVYSICSFSNSRYFNHNLWGSTDWLNSDVCDRNSPNCILTRVLGFTVEGSSIPLTFEGNNRFCRLANGDLDDEDVGDDEDQTSEDERAAGESEREVSLPRLAGVSLSGRRTTLFQL